MRFCLLLLVLALLFGCGHVWPSAAASPSPLPSAAQPAVSGRGDLVYARRGAEMIQAALHELDPVGELVRVDLSRFVSANNVSVWCINAPGVVPILLCHFGPSKEQPVAQAIFWYDQDAWQFQLYPQAPSTLANERKEFLSGKECQIGCLGAVVGARQSAGERGPELLAVINLSAGAAAPAEEVQSLRLVDGTWEIAWVPGAGDWNYGHARVTLAAQGMASFRVRSSSWTREDALSGYLAEPEAGEHRWFSDRWERTGTGYVLRDRAEEATPFSSLARAIHYLSIGADEKAGPFLSSSLSLSEAKKALTQKPRRQGWKATRSGDFGFTLDTQNDGRPDWGVRLEQAKDRWLVAEIRPIHPDAAPAH